MRRTLAFASRNGREILRDPLSLLFGIGFPVVLLLLIGMMKRSIRDMPAELFAIETFAPGMAVFGLSFLSLFLGLLMSGDRTSAFLTRLFASPMRGMEYVAGYSLPLLPMALCQGIVCFITAAIFGLPVTSRLLLALFVLLPVGLLFIGFGLLLGCLFTGGQVGGMGSILVNLAAWLSGTWFSLDMIGGAFRTICNLLPFAHAVEAVKAALTGELGAIPLHLLWVLGYAALLFFLAALLFRKKMKQ